MTNQPAGIHPGANLYGADLHGADLYGADLRGADLSSADLYGADLRGADLHGANLYGANLRDANLHGADLHGADLRGANLRGANLRGADLSGANLYGADLSGADLSGADLCGAKNIPEHVRHQTNILPAGRLIGWKKGSNGAIIKLRIPAKARRSNATGRKCRAEYADVLEVIGAETAVGKYYSSIIYRAGERVTADSFDDDWTVECGHGIHFFITRYEAEQF